ncbi:B3 domain-containing protein [Quillaja saponaria]|uniref:B3 domain-containing protein n=1 Tax=Quillaja saponaria TaxID=32244 RepID=A0AAD7KZ73_QUISA|nr:B3 domain-containing protein [Quillaja saponaria]
MATGGGAAASSSTIKTCFHCKTETAQFRKGWKLRSGGFAELCDQCGDAFERGTFCETFHLDSDGWRDCAFCRKMIHCGCIMSYHMLIELDFGGVCCIDCMKDDIGVAEIMYQLQNASTEFLQNFMKDLMEMVPAEVGLSVENDKVMAETNFMQEDPVSSAGSAIHCVLPSETEAQLADPGSPCQRLAPASPSGEHLHRNSPSGIDISCDPYIDSAMSQGVCCELIPHQHWPRIRDEELLRIPLDDTDVRARIVIPKKCAEAYFPKVHESRGLPITVQDTSGKDWEFNFCSWMNARSQMYVLEGLKDYMALMQCKPGDIVSFFRTEPEGKLVIGTRKSPAVSPPVEELPPIVGRNKRHSTD